MLMSKSRLEKFLYALYSLDSSDLPTPLSRIEELYKCWVTGEEAPTFEPISRVEKYLMAILGVYDVDSLPNPLSRVEVLLYKLATGDDNLDDIKTFLSEHEELLAEIIRNGGVGGNIDIEYVLYTLSTEFNTLYNTAEKPVKSAILKGNRLMNIFTKTAADVSNPPYLTVRGNVSQLKSQTKYTIKYFNLPEGKVKQLRIVERDINFNDKLHVIPINGCGTFTIQTDLSIFKSLIIQVIETEKGSVSIEEMNEVKIVILEGDYTGFNIPYFDGIQSVKMPVLTTTGKNLWDGKWYEGYSNLGGGGVSATLDNLANVYRTDYIKIPKNSNIVYGHRFCEDTNYTGLNIHAGFYDKNKQYLSLEGKTSPANWSVPTNAEYVVIHVWNSVPYDFTALRVNIGNTQFNDATYEPYKSNILTVNEDVTLRSNGGVYDELNLLTGRLTQRINENNEVLAQTVVKTVDLSVVDQDGNDTKLSTFDDITHVTLSSEGLIPEAELKVATKNEEVLNTMCLEMDDISADQTTLEETSNTQSENVDATMIATTEIYEGLL